MEDDLVAQFTSITGSSTVLASQYLRLGDGNLEQAIGLFYANEGADLAPPPQPSQQPPPVPAPATRPQRYRPTGYEDGEGIVHLDSDEEEQGHPDGDEVEVIGQRQVPAAGRSASASRNVSGQTPPTGQAAGLVDDDEAMARRLQEEYYGAAETGGARDETLDEHGYRAPISRTTETLVGPESFEPSNASEMRTAVMEQMMARRQARPARGTLFSPQKSPLLHRSLTVPDRHGIFNQATAPSIWNDADPDPRGHRDQLARATGGASEASSKSNILAEMFRPPFELMSRLSWDQARQEGKDGEKWILVDIQEPSIFDCQVLNRDIWKNPGIMDTVKENFIFMQYSKDDPRGSQYIQYYFQNKDNENAYPHIAIVDPRTGEQVKVWSGPPAPKAVDFLMQLHEFLDRYSLKVTAKNPVARRKPEPKKETQVERMTEEQQMEMALQASLAGTERRQEDDPDELTRSFGNVDQSKGKGKAVEEDEDMIDAGEPTHTNGTSNPAASPFSHISSTSPHTEPPPDAPATTRIQFRHPNGRVVRRFALSDTVRRIYEWLKASPLEGKEGVELELIFMQKNLIEALDDTIEQAGLRNGTVMIEFIEDT